jgi:hypothetical protein
LGKERQPIDPNEAQPIGRYVTVGMPSTPGLTSDEEESGEFDNEVVLGTDGTLPPLREARATMEIVEHKDLRNTVGTDREEWVQAAWNEVSGLSDIADQAVVQSYFRPRSWQEKRLPEKRRSGSPFAATLLLTGRTCRKVKEKRSGRLCRSIQAHFEQH